VDFSGIGRPSYSTVWTVLDTYGRRLEMYGSGGWVFESPRARARKTLALAGDFIYFVIVDGLLQGDLWEPFTRSDLVGRSPGN